jgi:integrase
MKYAFKHYLTFIDKPELYESLHKIKIPPRKKMGVYRSPDLIRELINSIEFERHRDKALIQYAIGARARGVITLHENRLDLHFEDDAIRIILREKGDKEQEAFLHRSFEPILKRYMGHGYLFLPKEANNFEPQDFERCVENERTYYFSAVSEAAKKMGMNRFGTHDFRRNAIDNWDKMVDDDSTVQQGAGHSDKRMTERYIGKRRQEVKHMMLNHQMDVK